MSLFSQSLCMRETEVSMDVAKMGNIERSAFVMLVCTDAHQSWFCEWRQGTCLHS